MSPFSIDKLNSRPISSSRVDSSSSRSANDFHPQPPLPPLLVKCHIQHKDLIMNIYVEVVLPAPHPCHHSNQPPIQHGMGTDQILLRSLVDKQPKSRQRGSSLYLLMAGVADWKLCACIGGGWWFDLNRNSYFMKNRGKNIGFSIKIPFQVRQPEHSQIHHPIWLSFRQKPDRDSGFNHQYSLQRSSW